MYNLIMDGDKFISTQNNNVPNGIKDEDNFFLQTEESRSFNMLSEPIRHLNDYDSNILQDGAYRGIKDNSLRLEYKIAKTEEDLNNINKQIHTANDMYDYYTVNILSQKKLSLEDELRRLTELYKDASFSAKLSGGITTDLKKQAIILKDKIIGSIKVFLPRLPKKILSFLEVRNSLNKLENINNSVNELMNMRYPYGEIENYDKLSKYIVRANSIQSQISKIIK